MKRLLGFIAALTVGQWREIDREAAEEQRLAAGTKRYDWTPLLVLVTACVSLTLQHYYGDRGTFQRLFPFERGVDTIAEYRLSSYGWWGTARFVGYVVIPVIAIWIGRLLGSSLRVRDCFVSVLNFWKHLWIYALLFGVVFPAVLVAAKSSTFTDTYPFYRWANQSWELFFAWEAYYALQFISLEFFFRGYMLAALKPKFGSGAIFVMLVPYCMIHFGKPIAETFGAILAGLALGTLAMRTRSVWGGALIHIAVAVTMDVMALDRCPPQGSGIPCGRSN